MSCIVCLDNIEHQPSTLKIKYNCKHCKLNKKSNMFHTDCINKWFVNSNKCPICRAELTFKYKNCKDYKHMFMIFILFLLLSILFYFLRYIDIELSEDFDVICFEHVCIPIDKYN